MMHIKLKQKCTVITKLSTFSVSKPYILTKNLNCKDKQKTLEQEVDFIDSNYDFKQYINCGMKRDPFQSPYENILITIKYQTRGKFNRFGLVTNL